jgi:hypothetical protein
MVAGRQQAFTDGSPGTWSTLAAFWRLIRGRSAIISALRGLPRNDSDRCADFAPRPEVRARLIPEPAPHGGGTEGRLRGVRSLRSTLPPTKSLEAN